MILFLYIERSIYFNVLDSDLNKMFLWHKHQWVHVCTVHKNPSDGKYILALRLKYLF